MPDLPPTRYLEKRQMTHQVGPGISHRVIDRIAHPGLRAEVDDRVDFLPIQRLLQRSVVGEIELVEVEPLTAGRGRNA